MFTIKGLKITHTEKHGIFRHWDYPQDCVYFHEMLKWHTFGLPPLPCTLLKQNFESCVLTKKWDAGENPVMYQFNNTYLSQKTYLIR